MMGQQPEQLVAEQQAGGMLLRRMLLLATAIALAVLMLATTALPAFALKPGTCEERDGSTICKPIKVKIKNL